MSADLCGSGKRRYLRAVRIGLDLTGAAVREPSGTALYARALLDALLQEVPDHEYVACYRLSAFRRSRWRPRRDGLRVRTRYYWDAFDPLLARSLDLFHGLDSRAARFGRVRQVVTLHDVVHLSRAEFATKSGRAHRTDQYRLVRDRADAILTPSEFERGQIVERLGVPEDRVRVVPLAPAPTFAARQAPDPAVLSRFGLEGRYVLCVAVLQERKNVVRLLEAFGRLDPEVRLVLAGPVRSSFRAAFEAAAAPLRGRAVRLGYVPNETLPSLYAGAACLAVVSEYESFGLPVVEAMACGCPVVAARAAALPEVAGDAAALCDPASVDSIAQALHAVLTDAGLRDRLTARGLARSAQYSYRRVARETARVYAELA